MKHSTEGPYGKFFIALIPQNIGGIIVNREEQKSLLRELQEVDFVLVELTLYLDTHPSDHEAINQYNECAKKRDKIRYSYEERYGPLTNFGHTYNRYPDGWSEGPWPWEI
jgi:spore coat protein JB